MSRLRGKIFKAPCSRNAAKSSILWSTDDPNNHYKKIKKQSSCWGLIHKKTFSILTLTTLICKNTVTICYGQMRQIKDCAFEQTTLMAKDERDEKTPH